MSGSFGMNQSKSNQSSRPVDITPQSYQNLRPQLSNMLSEYMWGGPEYSGPMVAGLTGDERAGLADVKGQATNLSPLSSAARGELMNTLSGSYLNPDSNPFLQGYIEASTRPISQRAEEQRMAERSAFGIAGQRLSQSSPFARASAIRDRGELDAIGDVTSRIGTSAYEGERGRMTGATTAAEAATAGQFNRSMDALKAAALPRLIAQLGIDNGMKEFARRAEVALAAAGIAGNISSLFGTQSKGSSSSSGFDSSGGIGKL
jgi:hypothetical protein